MQVSVETTQGLGRQMTLILPPEQIEQAVDVKVKQKSSTVKLKGFRPGKVPVAMVKQYYGASIRQEVINELMKHHFDQAVADQQLHLVDSPHFTPVQNKPGEAFIYQVAFEVYPQIIMPDLACLEIEQPIVTITEQDVEMVLNKLYQQQGTWYPVEHSATAKDRVVVDFTGTIDGTPFEGGSATDFPLNLAESHLIDGFAEGIFGHQVGDRWDLEITFPHDYSNVDLAGRAAQFAMHLKKIEAFQVPEWNAELLSRLGSVDGTVESLKSTLHSKMLHELPIAVKLHMKEVVVNALLEAHGTIEAPTALLHREMDLLHQRAQQRARLDGYLLTDAQLPRASFEAAARRRVAVSLLLAKLVNQLAVTIDETHVQALLEEMAASYEDPEQVIHYYHSHKHMMENVAHLALEAEVIAAMLAVAKVTEKAVTFSEFMQQTATVEKII